MKPGARSKTYYIRLVHLMKAGQQCLSEHYWLKITPFQLLLLSLPTPRIPPAIQLKLQRFKGKTIFIENNRSVVIGQQRQTNHNICSKDPQKISKDTSKVPSFIISIHPTICQQFLFLNRNNKNGKPIKPNWKVAKRKEFDLKRISINSLLLTE